MCRERSLYSVQYYPQFQDPLGVLERIPVSGKQCYFLILILFAFCLWDPSTWLHAGYVAHSQCCVVPTVWICLTLSSWPLMGIWIVLRLGLLGIVVLWTVHFVCECEHKYTSVLGLYTGNTAEFQGLNVFSFRRHEHSCPERCIRFFSH